MVAEQYMKEAYFICSFDLFLANGNKVRAMYGIGRDSDGLMLSSGNSFRDNVDLTKMLLFPTVKAAKGHAKSVGLKIRR